MGEMRTIRIRAAAVGLGIVMWMDDDAMYFSDWDDVQRAFRDDAGLLRFLRTGKYEEDDDD